MSAHPSASLVQSLGDEGTVTLVMFPRGVGEPLCTGGALDHGAGGGSVGACLALVRALCIGRVAHVTQRLPNPLIVPQVIGGTTWHKIPLTIENLIIGDFGAGAAMITFGAILGKCNLQQLFFLVFWEMFLWGLNESIGVQKYKATDMGGSMFVHAFGAYYGVAATWFFQPKRTAESKNLQDGYISEVTALLGSIFLWMYWPSFNGALAVGAPQHRVVVNTVLSIGGSCVGAACVARWLFGKLEMEIMVNATLAGGVAIGSASDIITDPWATMTVGLCAGAFSAFSFQRIGPFLSRTINLQDTCGVNSLHGMPGILGAIVSIIAIAMSNSQGFPSDYFPKVAAGGSLGDQCAAQAYALLTTLGIAVAGGLSGGFIASLQPWHPVHALFRDDDHFWEVVNRYGALCGGDLPLAIWDHLVATRLVPVRRIPHPQQCLIFQ